jgi:hypothetical protein
LIFQLAFLFLRRKKNMKKRNGFLIAVLVLLVLAISGFTYAYWANAINAGQEGFNDEITVGTGKVVSTTVSVSGSGHATLVPKGRAEDSEGEVVEEVILTYSIQWEEVGGVTQEDAEGTLVVTITNEAIDGDLEIGAEYAVVEITAGNGASVLLNGEAVTVTISVTLKEPTQVDYVKVAGKEITFNLDFVVTEN